MGNMIVGLAISHKDYIIGAVVGYSLAHIRIVIDMAFDAAMKIPSVHAFVIKNSDAEKAAITEISDELKKEIDAEKAKDSTNG